MRRQVVLLGALALMGCPSKAPPTPATTAPTPTRPSWAPRADPNAGDDPCPTTPPTGWRLELGYGQGDQAEALASAREMAFTKLAGKACEGVSELRCASIKRHISPWKAGRYDPEQRSACAASAIEASQLHAYDTDLAKLELEITALAARVADAAGGKPLLLGPPSWGSGCVAGQVGASLASRLRNSLSKAGVNVLSEGSAAQTLRLDSQLQPGRDLVTLTAQISQGARPPKSIAGFDFRPDLFVVDEREVGECRGDANLGLPDGAKAGRAGLRVWIDIPTQDGVVCEGARLTPSVHVSAPAQVQVFSVDKRGTAYLIWPPPDGMEHADGLIQSDLALDPVDVVSLEGFGDETLVAVAAAGPDRLGPTHGAQAFCKLDPPFGAMSVGTNAAVGRTTYHVLPAGRDGCPAARPNRAGIIAALEQAPSCPTR